MDERRAFIAEALRPRMPMSGLCRAFGISRKTGYKLLARYLAEGPLGVPERSRAPHHHPHAIAAEVRESLLAARRTHPNWGPRKLRAWLAWQQPQQRWPAASSIGALLRRAGVVPPRPRRPPGRPSGLTVSAAPNDVWTIDFKGWFRTRDGARCDPLTLLDDVSRYLLQCVALAPTTAAQVQPQLERAFREYGLPAVLRSDNGPPFAVPGVPGALSRLAAWWIKLGIRPERIAPGHPEQNPRHERLHWTLQQETATPPAPTRCGQQRRFDRFRAVYNHQRPHEALGNRPPATVYQPSPRPYPARVSSPEYPATMAVRRVRQRGTIKWRGRLVFLSLALVSEPVGLEEVADGCWRIYFGAYPLGCLHAEDDTLHPVEP